ncbi:TPA: V-type ATPase subunit [archaeon]|nr:V-type ATPase subunit [Candidatus Undinarchaeales archaeon SRR5007147.bin71]
MKITKKFVPVRGEISGEYYYAGTRARAGIAKRISDLDYDRFLKMDINEIVKFLEERNYKEAIDTLGMKYSKVELIERALYQNFAQVIDGILKYVPEQSPLITYVTKYDIYNIKSILRGKSSGRSNEELERVMIPAGNLRHEFYLNLIETSSSVADVLKGLKGTQYYKVLAGLDQNDIEELEDALDKSYYEKILASGRGDSDFMDFVREEIDIKNAVTILRLGNSKTKVESKYFIAGGKITVRSLKALADKDLTGIYDFFKKRKFWKYVESGIKDIGKMETGLRKYLMMRSTVLLRDYNPNLKTVLGYIIVKEREMANVRMLVRSKQMKNAEMEVLVRSGMYLEN